MANNLNLCAAKAAKNDEFYSQYADIQKEINAYFEYTPDTFRDETVLLPCNDPDWSNFTRFFAQNFERLRMKKLLSTSYAVAATVKCLYEDFFVKEKKGVFEYILGGRLEPCLLNVRLFDEPMKKAICAEQTSKAEEKGISNSPWCQPRKSGSWQKWTPTILLFGIKAEARTSAILSNAL